MTAPCACVCPADVKSYLCRHLGRWLHGVYQGQAEPRAGEARFRGFSGIYGQGVSHEWRSEDPRR